MLSLPTTTPRDLSTWFADHQTDMLEDLRALVEQESPSNAKALLDEMVALLSAWVPERLCVPALITRHRSADQGDVLEMEIEGTGNQPILLVGHYDTVWPAGTTAHWPFTITDGKVKGPGVFDMKFGIVQMIWAVRGLQEMAVPHPPLRFIFNGDEETGSKFSREIIERAAADAKASIVTEPGGSWGAKTQRKGVGVFAITAKGLESHAGLAPSEGASAIHAISDAIQHLVSAADPVRGTTINIGTISGGTARNVVAGSARCEIDVRISDTEEMERLNHVFRQLTPCDSRIRLDLEGGWNRPPMVLSEASRRLFDLANEVALQLQGPLAQLHVGGGSDANFIAALGYPVLCGIGATGDGAHARHEHILTADIADRTALLAGMLYQIGTTGEISVSNQA